MSHFFSRINTPFINVFYFLNVLIRWLKYSIGCFCFRSEIIYLVRIVGRLYRGQFTGCFAISQLILNFNRIHVICV